MGDCRLEGGGEEVLRDGSIVDWVEVDGSIRFEMSQSIVL